MTNKINFCYFKNPLLNKDKIEIFSFIKKENKMIFIYKKK